MGSRKSKKKGNKMNRKMSAAADSSDKSTVEVEVWYKLVGGVVSPRAAAVECVRNSTSIRKLRDLIHAKFDQEKKNRISSFELIVKTADGEVIGRLSTKLSEIECGESEDNPFIVEVPAPPTPVFVAPSQPADGKRWRCLRAVLTLGSWRCGARSVA